MKQLKINEYTTLSAQEIKEIKGGTTIACIPLGGVIIAEKLIKESKKKKEQPKDPK